MVKESTRRRSQVNLSRPTLRQVYLGHTRRGRRQSQPRSTDPTRPNHPDVPGRGPGHCGDTVPGDARPRCSARPALPLRKSPWRRSFARNRPNRGVPCDETRYSAPPDASPSPSPSRVPLGETLEGHLSLRLRLRSSRRRTVDRRVDDRGTPPNSTPPAFRTTRLADARLRLETGVRSRPVFHPPARRRASRRPRPRRARRPPP